MFHFFPGGPLHMSARAAAVLPGAGVRPAQGHRHQDPGGGEQQQQQQQ